MTWYLVLKIWPFYGPGYWVGYLGASRPMLLCVTLRHLINCSKTAKILVVEGLKLLSVSCVRFIAIHLCFRYYCFDCHDDEQYFIPAKVISQWQFKRFKGNIIVAILLSIHNLFSFIFFFLFPNQIKTKVFFLLSKYKNTTKYFFLFQYQNTTKSSWWRLKKSLYFTWMNSIQNCMNISIQFKKSK